MSQTVFAVIFMTAFFGLMIGIGFYYNKKKKVSSSSDEYILAGRSAPLLIVAGSFFATMVSTGTVSGNMGSGYSNGLSAYWSGGCFMTASMWAGMWIIPRLRATGITTIPELFEKYFGGGHRILALLLSLCRDLGVIASVVLVLGQIFQAMFGIGFWISVILTAGVVIIFTASGGMWAVLVTDTIQAAFIIVGSTILIPLGIYKAGGYAAFVAQVPASHSEIFAVGVPQAMGWFLVGTFTLLGYQTMLQRGLAAKDDKTAQDAFFYGGLIGLFWYAVPFINGIIAKVLFPEITASDAFYTISSLFGEYGNVFFLSVLLMSGMSTVSSCILTTTANVTLDVYKRFINPGASEKSIVILQRWCLLFIVALCTWIGQIYPYVVELFWIGGRLMVCGLAPVLVTMLLWEKARRAPISTFLAMLGGAGACLWAQWQQAAAATAAAGSGAVVFVWKMDPVLFGLPVCFAVLIIGALMETSKQTPEVLLAHTVKQAR